MAKRRKKRSKKSGKSCKAICRAKCGRGRKQARRGSGSSRRGGGGYRGGECNNGRAASGACIDNYGGAIWYCGTKRARDGVNVEFDCTPKQSQIYGRGFSMTHNVNLPPGVDSREAAIAKHTKDCDKFWGPANRFNNIPEAKAHLWRGCR